MKAIPVARAADLAIVPAYAAVADRLLFDAKPDPGDVLPGGNGRVFDWTLLAGLDPGVPVMLPVGSMPVMCRRPCRSSGWMGWTYPPGWRPHPV